MTAKNGAEPKEAEKKNPVHEAMSNIQYQRINTESDLLRAREMLDAAKVQVEALEKRLGALRGAEMILDQVMKNPSSQQPEKQAATQPPKETTQ